MGLYEELRKENYLYVQGKNPNTLKACCEYIEGIIGKRPLDSQRNVASRHHVTEVSLRNHLKEIMLRLNLKPEEHPLRKSCENCPYYLAFHKKEA